MEPPSTDLSLSHPAFFFALLLLLSLLLLSALLSASETAYFSLSPQHIDKLKKTGNKNNRRILSHLARPNDLLSTVLLFNNMVNISIILLSTWMVASLIDFSQNPTLGFIIETAALTFILAFSSEITPKILAAQYPEQLAGIMAAPLQFLMKLAQPFNWLTQQLDTRINKGFGARNTVSIDELSQAVDITTSESAEDKKILKGIVRFVNIDVKSIMLPRVKMAAIEIHTPFMEMRRQVIDYGYSRIPVYEGTLDNIRGFLPVKDLLPYIQEEDDLFHWQKLVRECYFVPEQKKINDLLEEFRQKKIHLAIVVDEFGGTEGLVTLEDILEEIVGEISDETD